MTLKELAREIEIIKDNHLAHMQEDIDRIEKKIEKVDNRLWWILSILIAGVILPVVVSFFTNNI